MEELQFYDSQVECTFAEELNARTDIKLFLKLPAWFEIETPLGTYNPDWAIVQQPDGKDASLYLVRETKGNDTFLEIPNRSVGRFYAVIRTLRQWVSTLHGAKNQKTLTIPVTKYPKQIETGNDFK